MSYRDAPSGAPLVVFSSETIQAFDSTSGKPLWSKKTNAQGQPRVATTINRVLISVGTKAFLLETATGREIASVDLWFYARGAVCEGDVMALVGPRGLACFGPTGYLWGIRQDTDEAYWVEDPTGQRITKLDSFVGKDAGDTLGITLGRSVFQPDESS